MEHGEKVNEVMFVATNLDKISPEDTCNEELVIWDTIKDVIKKRWRPEVRAEEEITLVTTGVDHMVFGLCQGSVNNQEACGVDSKDDIIQMISQIEDTNNEEPDISDIDEKMVRHK